MYQLRNHDVLPFPSANAPFTVFKNLERYGAAHQWLRGVRFVNVCVLFVVATFASSDAFGSRCSFTIGAEDRYRHIFVARLPEARVTDWAESSDSYVDIVRGPLVLEETITGDPEKVPYLYHRIHKWGSVGAGEASPTMPVGYSLIVYAKVGGPLEFGGCRTFRKILPAYRECMIYDVRKRVGVSQPVNEKCEREQLSAVEQRKQSTERMRAREKAKRLRQEKIVRIVEEAGYSYSDLTPLR